MASPAASEAGAPRGDAGRSEGGSGSGSGSGGGGGGELYLDDTWALWFHDPTDTDWTNASYSRVATICSANNFWAVQSLLGDKTKCGMFFLMREHVFPCWDDPHNAKGGCLSIKVPNEAATHFWEGLCAALLSETLLSRRGRPDEEALDSHEHVNGVSVTPKNTFCVFKIWIGEHAPQDPARYDIPPFMGQMLFRTHATCMADAAVKPARTAPKPV